MPQAETLVRARSYDPNVFPNSPAGRMRIVSEYRIDMAALSRKVEEVRSSVRAWEAGLGDFRKACERIVQQSGDILVT